MCSTHKSYSIPDFFSIVQIFFNSARLSLRTQSHTKWFPHWDIYWKLSIDLLQVVITQSLNILYVSMKETPRRRITGHVVFQWHVNE